MRHILGVAVACWMLGCGPAPQATQPRAAASPKPAPAETGEPNRAGRLPPADIQNVVRAHFGDFRDCYHAGLKRNPDLEGKVTVRFVIDTDGKVASATGSGEIGDEEVVSCVVDAAEKLTFPRPEGGTVTVSYPIVFTQDAEAEPGTPAAPKPTGRLAPAQIQKVMRANFSSFRKCYEKGLADDPKLAGRVTVRFVIDLDGTVSSASGASDFADHEIDTCVVGVVKKLVFPKPEGGIVSVSYPIVFSPEADKP
jgi:TonB family protein